MKTSKKWSAEEFAILRAHVIAGKPFMHAAAALPGRTFFSVRAKYLWLQVRLIDHDHEDIDRPESLAVKRDATFQAAVMAAIKAGLENPPVGIVTTPDNADYRPTVFHPEPVVFGSCALADL